MPDDKMINFEVDNDLKQEFLDKQTKGTRETYTYILQKTDEFEKEIGKSVYDFNIEERDELLLVQFKNKSKGVVQSTLSPLRRYVDFCIAKNLVLSNENKFAIILDYQKYVNAQAQDNVYVSREENRELQKKLVNPQDRLMLELLSWGIRGRTQKGNTCEELINLMKTDVDYENKVIIASNNDEQTRVIPVDQYTVDLIKETISRETYICCNGTGTMRELQFNDSIYVFRIPGRTKFGQADHFLFTRRFQDFRKWLDKPYLSIGSLYFSAMVDEAKKIKAENGELTSEDYFKINKKFKYGDTEERQKLYSSKTAEMIRPYLD